MVDLRCCGTSDPAGFSFYSTSFFMEGKQHRPGRFFLCKPVKSIPPANYILPHLITFNIFAIKN